MRSKLKLPFFTTFLWKCIFNARIANNIHYYTKNKSILLHPLLLNFTFSVYNGKSFFRLKVKNSTFYFKLGNFILTRKTFIFKSKKRKKTQQKKKKKKK